MHGEIRVTPGLSPVAVTPRLCRSGVAGPAHLRARRGFRCRPTLKERDEVHPSPLQRDGDCSAGRAQHVEDS
jgi:hypothetical protein